MEASWLIERLDNPALLQKGDEQRLRELIASYPYFSAPYLLLARSLHEQKHPAFEQLLPLISLQAFDRKRLFRLIHEETMGRGDEGTGRLGDLETRRVGDKENDFPTTFDEEVRGLGDEEEERLGDEENNIVRHAERSRSTTDEPESLDEKTKGIELVGAEDFLPDTDHETKSESPATTPRFAVNFSEIEKTSEEPVHGIHDELQEIPFLLTMDHGPWTIAVEEEGRRGDEETGRVGDEENDIVRHAERSRSKTDELESQGEEMRGLGDEEEGRRADEETGRVGDEENDIVRHAERSRSKTDELESQGEETRGLGDEEMSEAPNHKSDRIDFIHWLEKLQPVKKDEELRGLGDEEEGRRGDLETRRLGEEEKEKPRHPEQAIVLSDLEETSRRVEGPDPNALIDKFIQTNPSVSRVKERFYDPAVQARESERLDDSLITETLARIFVKQEKYERAIDAYRKLQLKYPEKSDYFAALILEINSKIN